MAFWSCEHLSAISEVDPCHGTISVLFDRQKQTRFCAPEEVKDCKHDMKKHLSAQQPQAICNLNPDNKRVVQTTVYLQTLPSSADSIEE